MAEEVTPIVEEYLETIYRIQEEKGIAKTSDLVKMLNVSPGTITNTVERLERDGYITHEPYKGVRLTDKGLEIAIQVVRRHRLVERLLTDILHIEWYKVHDAACRMEHSISEDLINPLEAALRQPRTCPHGSPIPLRSGRIIEEKTQPLAEIDEGEHVEIIRITNEDLELLEYLDRLGILPGVKLEVLEKAPFNGPLTLKVGGKICALSREMASFIQVKLE
ncbi:MAG: metal-dependent transcriptional regulator [Nitrososphaerota archaeon]|nr:metal-dependent transcriptional regulator [Candidatus Bathyarchaeota archaeon]MDW8048550.1 metal-dependent transcriptional regulator [Nitrososphaerota archaeon]